jgi:signal peptide peptidase SppA
MPGPRADLIDLDDEDDEPLDADSQHKLYPIDRNVAVIRIVGTLANRGAYIGASSGVVTYEGLHMQLAQAERDRDAKGVLLDFDTGGGEAAGCESLVHRIGRLAAKKPVWAALGDDALSAGYWLASAAGVITVPKLGGVGSIGCWSLHVDFSRALDAEGITPTLIQAGRKKTLGHPFKSLKEQEGAQAYIQKVVDECRQTFAESVAHYRGLSLKKVMDTEAGVMTGAEAVAAGFADEIADRHQALNALAKKVAVL